MFENEEVRKAIKYGAMMSGLYRYSESLRKPSKFFSFEITGLVIFTILATRMHNYLLPSYLVCMGGLIFFESIGIKLHKTKPFTLSLPGRTEPFMLPCIGRIEKIKNIDEFIDKICQYEYNGFDTSKIGIHHTYDRSQGIINSLKGSALTVCLMLVHVILNATVF